MQQWVLSVAGIAILSVLADIILPNGHIRKYIKTVIGIVVTLVVVQPIFHWLKTDVKIPTNDNSAFESTSDVSPQQQYLSYVEQAKGSSVAEIKQALTDAGFQNPTVTFDLTNLKYKVVFSEKYSDALNKKAQLVLQSIKPNYRVEFEWS